MAASRQVVVSRTKLWVTEKSMDLLYVAHQAYRTSMGFIDPRTGLAYIVEYIPDNEPAWTIADIRGKNDLVRILRRLTRNGWALELKGILDSPTWDMFGFPETSYAERSKMIVGGGDRKR